MDIWLHGITFTRKTLKAIKSALVSGDSVIPSGSTCNYNPCPMNERDTLTGQLRTHSLAIQISAFVSKLDPDVADGGEE